MKNRQGTLCIALVAGAVGFGTALMLGAGDPKAPHGQKMPKMDENMEKMMEACMAAGIPGPMHEKLGFFAGKWNCEVKESWTGETTTSSGSMTSEAIYGGRFIKSKYEGAMGDQKFQGTWIMGYSNAAKQFESLWFDSMSTGMMLSTGTMDQAGKKMSFSGEHHCPMTGELQTCRSAITITGADSFTMEMWGPAMDGSDKEALHMTINYKRTK